MKKKFRFLSCLPRSGSTLVANILLQNPSIHSTHTSGCLDTIYSLRNNWDTLVEHKAHPMHVAKVNVMRGILNSYYEDVDRPVVVDKCRGWVAYAEMIEEIIQEKAKILVCIRSIPDILSSLEKLHRHTSKFHQPPGEVQNYFQFQTIEGRCEYWMSGNNLVGIAYNRILDAVKRGFRDRLHFIHFERLTRDPAGTMADIYQFIGEPYFEHDFDNVKQVTQEDDSVHGYIGLHKVHEEVRPRPSDAARVLGESLAKKYQGFNLYF